MQGYSNSTPSELLLYCLIYPAFHAGLFKFNSFGVVAFEKINCILLLKQKFN
jgi:hypothetical protein